MTAGAYCNRDVVVADKASPLLDIARLMRDFHVGDIVIVEKQGDENVPIGIITDRDLVVEVIAQDVNADSLTVADIMSTQLVTVREDEQLLDTLESMRIKGIRRMPVVNARGGLEGILTAADVIELIAEAATKLTGVVKQAMAREQKEHP